MTILECQQDSSNKQNQFIFRIYTVFNLEQTNLFDDKSYRNSSMQDSVKHIIDLVNDDISEFENQSYYQLINDIIILKKECLIRLLHELVHWIGHPFRLDRDTLRNYYKSQAIRAYEELIAKMGSVFLSRYFKIYEDLINHVSYVSE